MQKRNGKGSSKNGNNETIVTIALSSVIRSPVIPAQIMQELVGIPMPAKVVGSMYEVDGNDFRKAVENMKPDVLRQLINHERQVSVMPFFRVPMHAGVMLTMNS
jgi:hypothetical protein